MGGRYFSMTHIQVSREDLSVLNECHTGLRQQNEKLIEERERILFELERISKARTLSVAKQIADKVLKYEKVTPFTVPTPKYG